MGVLTFAFPEDFNAMFRKEFVFDGGKFTIEVMELEILPKEFAGEHACFAWAFRLLVNGNIIEQGPYYWSVEKRRLTMENVANHLASYWGHTQIVKDAQDLAENNEEALNALVFKCADFMHEYFAQWGTFRDFEIITKFMDGNGWQIILSPNYIEGRLVEFSKGAQDKYITVETYETYRKIETLF